MLKRNYTSVCNITCAVLMLVLLILQFLPGYWTAQKTLPEPDGTFKTESPSLQLYMWAPTEFTAVDKSLDKQFEKSLVMNDAVMMPVVTLIAGVLTIFFTIFKLEKKWVAILPAIGGGFGVCGYLLYPVFQMNSMWIIHLIVSALIFVIGLGAVVYSVVARILAFKQELKEIAQQK